MPHSRSLLRVARRLTSSPAAAEDLVQDTLLAAWRSFHQFRPDTNVKAWLFRILLNHFYSQVRKTRPGPVLVALNNGIQALSPDPDDGMEISRALESLEAEHRTVLLLGIVEGFTCREMAGILEIPIGTVMSRLSRARKAMRARMAGQSPTLEFAEREG